MMNLYFYVGIALNTNPIKTIQSLIMAMLQYGAIPTPLSEWAVNFHLFIFNSCPTLESRALINDGARNVGTDYRLPLNKKIAAASKMKSFKA